jgi:alpha-ribazole phosphatase
MKVWFMRHGQTNYNLLELCNDDPHVPVCLTEQGMTQAGVIAERLRARPLECIFVSALPRTHQSAEIVNRQHGVPIVIRPELNDIRSGFESRPVAEYFAATGHDRLHLRVNGGESLLDYKARVLSFVRWLSQQPLGEVLVVAHKETLRVVAAHFEGLSDEAMIGLHFDNAALLSYELEPWKWSTGA